MTSGIRQIPPQVVLRVAERRNTVVREADHEQRLRDPGQLGSRARGQPPQLEELDGGGHSQLFTHLCRGDAKGEQRVLRDVEQDLAHWTPLAGGGARTDSSSPRATCTAAGRVGLLSWRQPVCLERSPNWCREGSPDDLAER